MSESIERMYGEPTGNRTATPVVEQIGPIGKNQLETDDPYQIKMTADLTAGYRAWEIEVERVAMPVTFDTEHLRIVHAHLMQDVYQDLGATRGDERNLAIAAKLPVAEPGVQQVRIGAGGQTLVLLGAENVNARINELGRRLNEENMLMGLEKPDFVARLADYYLEYTKAAPFPTGNEYVLESVLTQIGQQAGYSVQPYLSKDLHEVTDQQIQSGPDADKTRLVRVLDSVIEPAAGRLAELQRMATERVVVPEMSLATQKKKTEEEIGQAGVRISQRIPEPAGREFRTSMRAILTGDVAPLHLNVVRTAARTHAGEDLQPDVKRIEKATAYLDTMRQQEQVRLRQQDYVRAVPSRDLEPAPSQMSR